jgi:GPN-loop GTPase
MLHLSRAIDRATGFIFIPASTAQTTPPPVAPARPPDTSRANAYQLFSSAMAPLGGQMSDVRDVQERWVDAKEEWDAWEEGVWRREGEAVRNITEREKGVGAGGVPGGTK